MTSEKDITNYYVYIVRCADGTLYTGITTDVQRRVHEHNGDVPGGAKYTKPRRPVVLVYSEACLSRSEAMKREYEIKQLSHEEKGTLMDGRPHRSSKESV